MTTLAKQTEELNIETKNVETENIKKEKKNQIDTETENIKKQKKKQIDIYPAEDKIPLIIELAKQIQELNTKDVEIESKKNQQINAAEEKTSFVTTVAEQNEMLTESTPNLISIETVDNSLINILSSTKNFCSPLRPRNLSDNTIAKQQRKNDSNLSLIKSLSPVSKTADVKYRQSMATFDGIIDGIPS